MSEEKKPGDNGELAQKEMTPEAILAEKKAAFEKDPDQFIEMKDIIVCMIRMPGGIAHYIGPAKRSEYNMSKSELQYQIDKILAEMDAVKTKSSIINPFSKKKGAFGKKRF